MEATNYPPLSSKDILETPTAARLNALLTDPISVVGRNSNGLTLHRFSKDAHLADIPCSYYAHLQLKYSSSSTNTPKLLTDDDKVSVAPPNEIASLGGLTKESYEKGEIVFTRAHGFLTPKALERKLENMRPLKLFLLDDEVSVAPPNEIKGLKYYTRQAYDLGDIVYTRAHGFVKRDQILDAAFRVRKFTHDSTRVDTITHIGACPPYRTPRTTQTLAATAANLANQTAVSTCRTPKIVAQKIVTEETTLPESPNVIDSSIDVEVPYLPMRYVSTSFFADPSRRPPYTQLYDTYMKSLQSDQWTEEIDEIEESPVIRSPITWYMVCQELQNEFGSFLDVAPMARIALLSHALASDTALFDNGPQKTFRNLAHQVETLHIAPVKFDTDKFLVIAMQVNTFLEFISLNVDCNQVPEPFHPSGIDRVWSAVPVPNRLLSTCFVHEYIAAFFASDLTFGRISRKYSTETQDKILTGYSISVPASNLAYLEGPYHIILVLMDRDGKTVSTPNVKIGTISVPVFVRHNCSECKIVPARFSDAWDARFTNANIDFIRFALMRCWDYMCEELAAEETCGRALALAAELIPAATPGLFSYPSFPKEGCDSESTLIGAFGITCNDKAQTIPLERRHPYSIPAIDLTRADAKVQLTSYICGINLAALSALHIPPCGLVPIEFVPDTPALRTQHRRPVCNTLAYSTTQSSSLNRLAISLGLIRRCADPSHQFSEVWNFVGCIHKQAIALSANTAIFLQQNNIPTRDWSGYNTEDWPGYNTEDWPNNNVSAFNYSLFKEIEKIKEHVTNKLISHVEMASIMKNWPGYDASWFSTAYGGMNPFTDQAWYQQSPIPTKLAKQRVEIFQNPTYTSTGDRK